MDERRFGDLRDSLLRAGVAARTIRRVLLEVGDHFDRLVDDAMRRGMSSHDACAEARSLIGSNQVLLERYSARPELRTWCCRWPALYFGFLPTAAYLALSAVSMGILWVIIEGLADYLHKTRIPTDVSHFITLSMHWWFLGVLPAAIGMAFALLARRRGLALRLPLIGIAVLAVFASLLNIEIVLTGGAEPGYVAAGMGLSLRSLLAPAMRAVGVTLLAYGLMWAAIRRVADANENP